MPGLIRLRSPSAGAHPPLPAHLLVQYVGFHDTPAGREYVLLAQLGAKSRRYTVWIAQAVFTKRQALLQDGPDICFQKLRRELADSELVGTARIGVTESDLTHYREAHAPATRRPAARPAFA